MYDDNPSWRCYFNLLQALYKEHPVRVDIAGTVESISHITKDTLYKCYNTFYHPSNMYICVVGDFDVEKITETIDRALKPLSPEKEIPRSYPSEPVGACKHKVVQNLPVSSPMFCIGFKDNGVVNEGNLVKRDAAVSVAIKMLFGKSSDCNNKLYDSGLIRSQLGYDYTLEEPEYAFIEISGESENPEKVGEIVLETAKKFEFNDEDFISAKNSLYGIAISSLDDSEQYMQSLSRSFTAGRNMFDLFDALAELTKDDVKRICNDIFREENYCISIIKNK